ncbi:MAG: hypothetical protein GXO74_01695 [Calditrichaeota bacterium]|nr:hypothetical protein [Calditrichota bacterium]
MKKKKSKITANKEAQQITTLVNDNFLQALNILEGQLNVLHLRAQVLMSLAGIVITVTGFSGRSIAGTSLIAQILIIAGLATVLTSAVWVFLKVMTVKWLTAENFAEPQKTLIKIIERRNRKTRAFVNGGKILCFGLFLYAAAFALMLLHAQ